MRYTRYSVGWSYDLADIREMIREAFEGHYRKLSRNQRKRAHKIRAVRHTRQVAYPARPT